MVQSQQDVKLFPETMLAKAYVIYPLHMICVNLFEHCVISIIFTQTYIFFIVLVNIQSMLCCCTTMCNCKQSRAVVSSVLLSARQRSICMYVCNLKKNVCNLSICFQFRSMNIVRFAKKNN